MTHNSFCKRSASTCNRPGSPRARKIPAADRDTLPDVLEVTARTEGGEIMGVRHRELAVTGVQFHPESVLTPEGDQLLANFLAFGVD